MHIPDGLLSAPVALTSAGLASIAVGAACARVRADLSARSASTIGVTAAFVFAAQMINFPVAGGTSGHLVGGVLTAVLLGPSSAVVVMTAVLILQCLVFADGGLLALGANVLNMAVLHPLVGFMLYRAVAGPAGPSGVRGIAGVAFGSWIATVVAAAACAGELTLSGIAPPSVVLPAMVGVHALIGLGEALIASLVVATVARLRPELLRRVSLRARSSALTGVLLGLSSTLALALFVSPFACRWPDGLTHVVTRLGIEPAHARLPVPAPLRGYAVAGLNGSWLSTSIAALAGTVIVFVACLGIGRLLAPKPGRAPARGVASRS
jgi:cobalt/nickel transport system permease protein